MNMLNNMLYFWIAQIRNTINRLCQYPDLLGLQQLIE